MKQTYTFLILTFFSLSLNLQAQAEITFDLRCSGDNSKYELYVTRNTTPTAAPFTNAGSSRVTLVFPTGARSVLFTNEGAVSAYDDSDPAIINPNGIGSDFYPFKTSGGASLIGTLPANVPTLWLTFTPSDGTSQNVRLFLNGSDPGSSAPGMGGVDLSNTFNTLTGAGIVDEYNGNVSGIVNCGTLAINKLALNNISLYPNPTKTKLYIQGDIADIKNIEIFSFTGQLVKQMKTNFNEIDVSRLESSIYLVRVNTENASKMFRVVKE